MFNILFNWLLLNSAAFKEIENMTRLGKMYGRLKVSVLCYFQAPINMQWEQFCTYRAFWGHKTDQRELIILQSRSSQHIRRLAWWSARTDGGTRMGSTSQFSSDSYKARIKSPTKCRLRSLYFYRKKKNYIQKEAAMTTEPAHNCTYCTFVSFSLENGATKVNKCKTVNITLL